MSGGFIVSGKAMGPIEGLSIRTFVEDGVHRFAAKGKRARAVEIVIHETVTRSVDSTIAVLKKRGLSVHVVMGADGALTQHGDLATDILWHASQHNAASFGVEVVNPYYPSYLKPGLPWQRVIKAPWGAQGRVRTADASASRGGGRARTLDDERADTGHRGAARVARAA